MKTDLQKRTEQLDEIILLAELSGDDHLTLRQQLESLSNLGVEVTHVIVTKLVTKENRISSERNYFERK